MLISESGSGWVFGIPLGKVIANDLELRRRRPSIMRERRESLDLPHPHNQSRYLHNSMKITLLDRDLLEISNHVTGMHYLMILSHNYFQKIHLKKRHYVFKQQS